MQKRSSILRSKQTKSPIDSPDVIQCIPICVHFIEEAPHLAKDIYNLLHLCGILSLESKNKSPTFYHLL